MDRRLLLGAIAAGWTGTTAAQAASSVADGHASGYDVAASSNFMPLVPRRPGDAAPFSTSLDKAALKATSGGWAREVTSRQLPLATGIAGAHLFLNPGGAREMHWHNSVEWAYVLEGACQVTVMDQRGDVEVVNFGPGDLWYFPTGHAHSIQALGDAPCHAILAFNDGLYSEHGTFGISDVLSRFSPEMLSRHLGVPAPLLASMPQGETYIAQGDVIAVNGPEAQETRPLDAARTHRFQLSGSTPWFDGPGGTIRVASAAEFPLSTEITGMVTTLKPDAMHVLHWHPDANEWLYVAKGRIRASLYMPDKHLGDADLVAGDCAYIPANCVHAIHNIGDADCEIVGVLDSGSYQESTMADWLAKAPRHLLANNLHLTDEAFRRLASSNRLVIAAG
ncbi:cupin domain-containing protein [Roseomonas elaeocarpi]|uniref:Cupin domain-containing protein n=1 Tax=Roseomonas elaeocarpi TaxID=907779 RepID=A0ABV6JP92_9PROT